LLRPGTGTLRCLESCDFVNIPALEAIFTTFRLVATEPLPPIHVSPDGRYFVKSDGTPFFWQAGTAW